MAPRQDRRVRLGLLRTCLLVSCCLTGPAVCADPLYTVTDLGAASPSAAYLSGQNPTDPSGNYLNALSANQQVAFQAGSFDVYAHPATGWWAASQQNPDATNVDDAANISGTPNMVTANNVGGYAGTASVFHFGGGYVDMIITFTANSHVVAYNDYSPYAWSSVGTQSNGYLNFVNTLNSLQFGTFAGNIAGLNDHGTMALNETTAGYGTNTISTPKLVGVIGVGEVSLGNLGGTNAMANALNNNDQVVGWSQTASGAQHAFLYSGSTMQDLNLLIPPLSGITLISAVGIDAAGDIVAYGTNSSGQMQEYYLSPAEVPAPEPSAFVVMGIVIAALAARHAQARRDIPQRSR